MNLREFVKTAVLHCAVGRGAAYEVVCLIEYDVVSYERNVLVYLTNSPFVAALYPDGSAQLLSRDEDECLLFATLWELER